MQYKFTHWRYETPIVACLVGAFVRFIAFIMLLMAGHGISWIPGTHVCFGTLHFVLTMEGELVQSLAPAQPSLTTSLDMIDEALEEL
jgi:hypothetical protein